MYLRVHDKKNCQASGFVQTASPHYVTLWKSPLTHISGGHNKCSTISRRFKSFRIISVPEGINHTRFTDLTIKNKDSKMIPLLIDLLGIDDFYGLSEEIDIAKGKHKLNMSFKEEVKRKKRIKAWQR